MGRFVFPFLAINRGHWDTAAAVRQQRDRET